MIDNSTFNPSNLSISQFIYGNKIPWTLGFSVQFFFAMIGNPLIVWIVYKDKRLKTTTNYLLANMAVNDFLAAIFEFPRRIVLINGDTEWLIGGDFGNILCKLYIVVFSTSIGVSLSSCAVIALDRYCAVAFLTKRPFQRRLKTIIACIWIVSGLLSSPNWYFHGTYTHGNQRMCTVLSQKKMFLIYAFFFYTLQVIIAIPIVSICYTLTAYKLYRHKTPGEQNDLTRKRREQQNKKVLKMCITMVCMLYFSLGWFFTYFVLDYFGYLRHLSNILKYKLHMTSVFLADMTFVYNFFVYLIFNNVYRENIMSIMAAFSSCCRPVYGCSSNVVANCQPSTGRESMEMDRTDISHPKGPGNDVKDDKTGSTL